MGNNIHLIMKQIYRFDFIRLMEGTIIQNWGVQSCGFVYIIIIFYKNMSFCHNPDYHTLMAELKLNFSRV